MEGRPLTPREVQILKLMSRGLTAEKIADQLDIRISTVRKHIDNVIQKLASHSQLEAVSKAREAGILKNDS